MDFSLKGLKLFLKGDLSKFDAQVGDNLCQIRAYKIIWIWKNISGSLVFRNQFLNKVHLLQVYQRKLGRIITKLETAVECISSYNKELDKPENIISFLERNNIFFGLNEDLIFIISCFFF